MMKLHTYKKEQVLREKECKGTIQVLCTRSHIGDEGGFTGNQYPIDISKVRTLSRTILHNIMLYQIFRDSYTTDKQIRKNYQKSARDSFEQVVKLMEQLYDETATIIMIVKVSINNTNLGLEKIFNRTRIGLMAQALFWG